MAIQCLSSTQRGHDVVNNKKTKDYRCSKGVNSRRTIFPIPKHEDFSIDRMHQTHFRTKSDDSQETASTNLSTQFGSPSDRSVSSCWSEQSTSPVRSVPSSHSSRGAIKLPKLSKVPTSQHSSNFRCKFYSKLGLLRTNDGSSLNQHKRRKDEDSEKNNIPSETEILKTDGGLRDHSLTNSSSPVMPALRTASVVSFRPQVEVTSIPNCHDLPESIHQDLWMSREEFVHGLERNTLEFAFEGFNWRNSIEETNFHRYYEREIDHLIHPAFYFLDYNLNPYHRQQQQRRQPPDTPTILSSPNSCKSGFLAYMTVKTADGNVTNDKVHRIN